MFKFKKILMFGMLLFCLSGCTGSIKTTDVVKKLGTKLEALESYQASVKMTSNKGGKNCNFDVDVVYHNNNYKVTLKNNENNTIQVLLKNTEGVYVLTPSLNKSFKFESDWPSNSYHAYLPLSVYKEISLDDAHTVTKDTSFVVSSKVNSKHNQVLNNQKVFLNLKTLDIEEVIVYDAQMNVQIDAKFESFNNKVELNDNDFKLEYAMTSAKLLLGEGSMDVGASFLEPEVVLEGSELVSKVVLDDSATYYYNGEKKYTIVQTKAVESSVVSSNRIYDDFLEINQGYGALTETSLSWYDLGIEYMIISSDLSTDEFIILANSFSK